MLNLRSRFWRRHRHRWITQQDTKGMVYRLLMLLAFFAGIIIVHSLGMMVFEDLTIRESLWLSIISATTIGYGDYAAQSLWGQLWTVLFICFVGIWLVAQIAGEWIDFRITRREAMQRGHWMWKHMKNHLVIINAPEHGCDEFLRRFLMQLRMTPEFENIEVMLVSDHYPDGLPDSLQQYKVSLSNVMVERADSLECALLEKAAYIVVLAKLANEYSSDSHTLDLLDRIKSTPHQAMLLAEVVQDRNVERFRQLGAKAVIRPVRGYPELIIRAMVAPGSEQILENLFTHYGESARRYEMSVQGKTWYQVVTCLVKQDLGMPLGYLDAQGSVITNPAADQAIVAKAIYVLVHDRNVPNLDQVRVALSSLSEATKADSL